MTSRALIRRDPYLVDALDLRRNFDDFFGRFIGAPILERWTSSNPALAWYRRSRLSLTRTNSTSTWRCRASSRER